MVWATFKVGPCELHGAGLRESRRLHLSVIGGVRGTASCHAPYACAVLLHDVIAKLVACELVSMICVVVNKFKHV